jgi:preprotein translocase subunit SecG
MLHIFIVILICIVAILLIATVLLQNSKGGGLTGAFGSAGASQVLGVRRTADFLSKTTGGLAAAFMILCIVAEFTVRSSIDTKEKDSVIQKAAPAAAPVTPNFQALPQTAPPAQTPAPQPEPSNSQPEKPQPDKKK